MALKIGEKITCKIIKVERERGAYKISLSRKALLNEQEARDVRQYTGKSNEGGVKTGANYSKASI